MVITHKVFLFWLLYFVLVIFGWGFLGYLGLPQIALHYDHSYLTYVLFGLYFVAEGLYGIQAWIVSKENQIADNVVSWLSKNKIYDTVIHVDEHMDLISKEKVLNKHTGMSFDEYAIHTIPPSYIAEHFALLCTKANANQKRIRHDIIIDIIADRLYEKTMIAEFISSRIVWIGILATILGVIMAFWPMIDGVSIDAMKTNLGSFFGGIAVAFIPTAVSFVFKIVLDFNSKIIANGVRDLIDKIVCATETSLLPIIDNENDNS